MATYCFSDLHGEYDLWHQIKKYLHSNDIAFCLGDCIDRGPDGIKILLEVLDSPNIIFMRGNHEDFLIYVASHLINRTIDKMELFERLFLWRYNGGQKSIEDFQKLPYLIQKRLIETLTEAPTYQQYINKNNQIIHLCHAGMQPNTKEETDELSRQIPLNNYLWDRRHLFDKNWQGAENEYCVHGHTPIRALKAYIPTTIKKDNEIYSYCGGHKIDIDLGSFATKKTCLFNLDTLTPIYFYSN